ncbi:ABC transporter, ATP-binding protein [Labilithrix luteola]|uniref:ABC transporter, ATP-binding protein n=1 Tax=Labilithrix luteola TaxID=1391654 RepID=A0A0K1PTB0_9BACT|nr:ABC transporter ATP-binding protein [Labilithrix luteola]AKU96621.1 ABC transporter, ATP-binding protein [Labilithrix luteola]
MTEEKAVPDVVKVEAPAALAADAPVATTSEKKKKKKSEVEVAVRLTKVTKRFGAKTAVDEVSLRVRAGSVYGLIGPNGAGKTTTFSMMAGFLKPTSGNVEVLGYSPTQVDELRSRLGVLPQDALLPASDKVGEFLSHMALLQDIPKDRVETTAREVLAEVEGRDWWNVRCGSLSHGMAKRVQLAQALLGDPEVVLLDEPTAGLDPRVAYEVRQLIKSRRGRCTLIVSSHNLQELEEICDGAAILDRGRVVASGSISELTAASEEIRIRLAQGPVPIPVVRDLPMVKRVEWDDERRELVVYFDRGSVDAETVIGHVLWALLQNQARISAVSKGRGLEQRVMDLT